MFGRVRTRRGQSGGGREDGRFAQASEHRIVEVAARGGAIPGRERRDEIDFRSVVARDTWGGQRSGRGRPLRFFVVLARTAVLLVERGGRSRGLGVASPFLEQRGQLARATKRPAGRNRHDRRDDRRHCPHVSAPGLQRGRTDSRSHPSSARHRRENTKNPRDTIGRPRGPALVQRPPAPAPLDRPLAAARALV